MNPWCMCWICYKKTATCLENKMVNWYQFSSEVARTICYVLLKLRLLAHNYNAHRFDGFIHWRNMCASNKKEELPSATELISQRSADRQPVNLAKATLHILDGQQKEVNVVKCTIVGGIEKHEQSSLDLLNNENKYPVYWEMCVDYRAILHVVQGRHRV